jgi:hypothetical protein
VRDPFETGTSLQKFIDDFNIIEPVKIDKTSVKCHAKNSEEVLKRVTKNALKLGMKLNAAKTQLLFITTESLERKSYVVCEGEEISSGDRLKLLGYIYGEKPTATEHVLEITRKFNQRIWVLRNLVRAGWRRDSILRIYKTVIRPMIEFSCVVYASLLSATQVQALEALQKRSLRMIFGWEYSYQELLSISGIETLAERRDQRVKKFAVKSEKSCRFDEIWYVRNTHRCTGRRNNK